MSELTREQIRRKAAIKKRIQQKAQAFQSQSESEQGYLGDSVDAFQHGLISGGADLADGVRYLTGSETAGNIADSWRGSAEEQINQMSPEGRKAMQSFGINTDDGLGFNEGSSLGGFGLNVISGLGSFAPTMIPGGLAARGLSTVGKVAGATGKAGKIADKAADVVGFGGVGALAIGGGTANQAYETVAKADLNTLAESEVFKQRYWEMRDYQEMGHEQALTEARESIAKEIAEEAAKDGAALGAISQGALGPVFGRLFRGEVGGYAKSIATGAATEGVQELVESGGQSAIANKNVTPAIPTDTMDGVVGDALTGAMTGAAVGGAFGAGGRLANRNRQQPEPEDTLPGEHDEATARADELQSEIDQLDDQIQNNSDDLSDAEYSALLQRREALLREQLGESSEPTQTIATDSQPFDMAGPRPEQVLGLPNQNIIYGEAPEPTQEQIKRRERTRQAYESQHGTARNTGLEGEYLGNSLPEQSDQTNQRIGLTLDGEYSPETQRLGNEGVTAIEDQGIIFGEGPVAQPRQARSDGLTDAYQSPQRSRKADDPERLKAKQAQEAQQRLQEQAKRQPLGLQPPENGPQSPRFDTIYGEYQPSEQQQAARETTRRSFEEQVPKQNLAPIESPTGEPILTESINSAAAETNTNPTEAQIEADNYKKGRVKLHGLNIAIENPKGSVRSGTDPDGKEWSSEMTHHYGDIKGIKGADGDDMDVFIGDSPESEKAFVVNQVDPKTGKFDEHKVMLGFNSMKDAEKGYLSNYEDNWAGLNSIEEISTPELKEWIKSGDTNSPFSKSGGDQSESVYQTETELSGKQINDSGKENPVISEEIAESGKENIKLAASGKPYATEKGARLSRTFSNTPNAEVVSVDGGFGVRDGALMKAQQSDMHSSIIETKRTDDPKAIEVDEKALGEWSSLQDLRTKAKSYAKSDLAGRKIVNQETGRNITISMSGLKHTIQGAKEDLLLTLPKTREILESAKYVGKSEDAKGNKSVLAHHYFETTVNVRGKILNVRADVREMTDGSFYYDHGFKKDESSDDNGSGPHLRTQGPSSESKPTSVVAEDNTIISEEPIDSSANKGDTGVAATPTKKINDVGEVITGAKKNQWQQYRDSISDEVDVANDPLSKSFPQPDYEKLAAEGESKRALALVAILRNQIPTKPKRAGRLATWVKTVNAVRDVASLVMKSPDRADSALDAAVRARVLTSESKALLDMMEQLPPSKIKEAATYQIGSGAYGIYNGERFSPPKVVYSIGSKHRVPELTSQGFDSAQEAANALKTYLSETDTTKSSKTAAKLDVYRDRYTSEAFVGWRSSAGVLRVEVFDDVKLARQAIAERRDELEAKLADMKRVPSMRETVNFTRVGPERRTGNVDAEEFREAFGFRGVQFGNYVEQGKRQKDLNEAYDGLMDLAELLNIPPRAISLDGKLGLAFGARGRGKYAAHYEPGQVVINLTKNSGSGSLAHEWWHALDNYFGNRTESADFITERAARKHSAEGVRKETADAFANVMLSIEQTNLRDRSSNLDQLRSKPYWATKVEMSARAFEAFVKTRLGEQGRSNDYLANIRSEEVWGDLFNSASYPYPTHGEMVDIANAYKDLFETLKNRETEDGIELFSVTDGNGEGMKADDVAKTLDPLINDLHEKNTFNVVQSINDLPFGIRLQAKAKLKQSKGENPVLRGINAGDKNYLIADGLRNEKEAVEIFLHEVVGHKAVLDMLGKDGDNIMEQIAVSYGRKGLADLIKTYGVEPNTKEGRILLGKEKVAHMAERGEKPAILKRLVAKVKAWLRNYFPSIKWSDNDVLSLISNARDNVENRYMTKVDLDAETETSAQEDSIHLSIRGDANPKDVNDIIGRTQAKPFHQKSMLERAKEFAKRVSDADMTAIKQGVIDSYASIEALEKKVNLGKLMDGDQSAYKAALRTANLDSVVEVAMRRGALEFKDGAFQIKEGTKGLLEVFQKIADSDQLQLWETWAGAKRAKRIMEEDARANLDAQAALKEHRATINQLKKTTPAKYPGGLTQWRKDMRAAEKGMKEARTRAFQKRERLYKPSDIQRIIKYVNDSSELKKEFEQAQKEWRQFNKSMLDMTEQAGLINPEARAIWDHDDYVPFHRVAEIEDGGGINPYITKRGLSGQKSGIQQLKGGVEKLNIIESMVRNTTHMIDASFKNIAMQRIVDMADGVAMEKIPAAKMEPEEVGAWLKELGYDPELMDADTLSAWSSQLERYNHIGKGTVSVSRNGKTHKYHVHDPLLYQSIAQLGPVKPDLLMKILQVPKRTLTTLVTADPGFMIANFMRDTLSTWVTVEPKTKPLYDAIKGAAKALKRDESLWQIMAAGGGGGGYYDTSPENVRQHLSSLQKGGALHKPKQLWDAWMRVGQAAENANRIAVFDSVIRDGGTIAEATHEAQDVINFSKRGGSKIMQYLIAAVPFLNARIQGLDRLWRGYRDNKASFAMKGMFLTAASLGLLALNWDNEEYWELEEWDRDANWHFFVGGEHFKIPKPFEVGAFFGTIPERAFEQLREDANGKLFAKRMLDMVLNTFAMDPTPQLFKPALDVAKNENGFTGNPILGFGDTMKSPEGQYSPWTSETMKQLAESMPDSAPEWMRSPKRLEYLFKGYFGTLGGYILGVTDTATGFAIDAPDSPEMTLGKAPVIKRFYSDELTSNKHVSRFYDMTDEVNSIYMDMKTKFEDGQREKAEALMSDNLDKLQLRRHLNQVRNQLSEISSKIRLIYTDKSMSAAEKRRRIDELTKRRNQIARMASLQYYDLF